MIGFGITTLTKNIFQAVLFIFILSNEVFAENANLPDFTKLVEANKASIVNISTVRKNTKSNQNTNPELRNDELNDFLKKFFGDKGFENPERKKPRNSQSMGSGFIYSANGYIITNHHVIDGCKDMKVHSKGNVLETTKISEDRRNDLALLKTTESPKHSFALSMESPFPLQDIVVAGFPLNRPGFTGDPEVRILGYGKEQMWKHKSRHQSPSSTNSFKIIVHSP